MNIIRVQKFVKPLKSTGQLMEKMQSIIYKLEYLRVTIKIKLTILLVINLERQQ